MADHPLAVIPDTRPVLLCDRSTVLAHTVRSLMAAAERSCGGDPAAIDDVQRRGWAALCFWLERDDSSPDERLEALMRLLDVFGGDHVVITSDEMLAEQMRDYREALGRPARMRSVPSADWN
jgi:hypothetical protein